jgi:uncharacterized protein (TIGR02118 family)
MSWVYEIALRGDAKFADMLNSWLIGSASPVFTKLPGLSHVDVYRPADGPSHDPYNDDDTPAPLQAPFSYVVRYHRPADDEAAFIKNYLDTHPVTQARLPGIRAIMCYLPLHELRAEGVGNPDYMIGNEVAFDDVEAFKLAMASPVRQELRAHYREFPRFTGPTTHFAMQRTRLDV